VRDISKGHHRGRGGNFIANEVGKKRLKELCFSRHAPLTIKKKGEWKMIMKSSLRNEKRRKGIRREVGVQGCEYEAPSSGQNG